MAASCLLLVSLLSAAPEPVPVERPNVLWICADDLAAHAIGAYGNKIVRTPNLDRLAAEGIRFDRAYCNSPVCTASRQSFLTGRYPRTIGVTKLSTPLPESEVTLAEVLKKAGYDTASIGKMHFNSNLAHGFDLRFDLPEYRKAIAQKQKERGTAKLPDGVEVLPDWKPFKDPARVWLNSFHRPYPAMDADMAGTVFAGEAEKYLSSRSEKPFFLMVSFYEPHSPFHFPVEMRDAHKPSEFTVPTVGPDDVSRIPAIFRDLTDDEKRGINAAYHTSVEFLDKNVGRVLDALQKSGKAQNTIVVFNGDHGYMLGHHGRFEKHCSFEEAVRVPLILRVPTSLEKWRERRTGATAAFVELIDVMPTILDYCGIEKRATVQGMSVRRLFNTHHVSSILRPYVIVEYAPNDEITILTELGRFKLIYERGKTRRTDGYDPGGDLPGPNVRFFDLKTDPGEMTNLADRPEHAKRITQMKKDLANHLEHTARDRSIFHGLTNPDEILDAGVQSRDIEESKQDQSNVAARQEPRPPKNATATKLLRVAAIVTAYHHNSHADVIVSRLMQTNTLDGKGEKPKLELVSLYTDQVPESDISRKLAAEHKVPIFDSVAGALTLGGDKLAVDGVLLIAEHGRYPQNETGNTIYPKKQLFGEIVKVFEKSGRVVPVFIDKHLADNWKDAKEIYDTAQRMKFPIMAGSSLPGLWRYPPADVPKGAKVKEFVATSYGGLDAYGFHALEMVQCLAERRAGGETGVASVQCLTGRAAWDAGAKGLYSRELLVAAISRFSNPLPAGKPIEELVKDPILFHIVYKDGLKASIFHMPAPVSQWTVAWKEEGSNDIKSTLFYTQEARPFMHFSFLLNGAEKMIHSGKSTWPVERTLMTSGLLDALLISKKENSRVVETPYLDIRYSPEWTWREPPPPPPNRPIGGQ